MKFLQIKETCIYTQNLEEARAFYHGLLGLEEIAYLPTKHLFLRAGSSVLLVFNPDDSRTKQSPPAHYASGKQHFAFEVPARDYEKAKAFIASKNIEITDEVIWREGVKSFYFNDPAGNIVEILPNEGLWD